MSPNPPHHISAPLPSDLSKLNVSQLKAICKERRIVGYSKLAKAALIHKICELGPCPRSPSSAQNTRTQAQATSLLSESGSSPAQVDASLAPAVQSMGTSSPGFSSSEPNTIPCAYIPQSSATSGSGSIPPSSLSQDRGPISDPSVSTLNVPVSKRISSEISLEVSRGHDHAGVQARPLAKKQKVAIAVSSPLSARADVLSPTSVSVHVPGDRGQGGVPDTSFSALPGSALVPGLRVKEGHQLDGRTQTISTSGKRFKPLKVTRPLSATLSDGNELRGLQRVKSASVTVHPGLLRHLDFYAPPEPPLLFAITIPPPLSQRKLVRRWAIILSSLSDKERFQCCLVSKLIRYAVYSSAYSKLSRNFSGRRLSIVLQHSSSPLMTNFWPYLRQREQEVFERKEAVADSFFDSAFRGPSELISERLWSSPENEKQVTVALRFLLTRLWFSLSVETECRRGVRTSWLHDTITDVVEIVKREIWSVTTHNAISGYKQVFHVLEATCEVLGQAGGTCGEGDEILRLDWAGYIEQRKTNPENTSPLCDGMRWADHAEFDRGISRHWLRRMAQMGEQGAALCTIAERYTLACVVGNSLSGRWMSAPQMAQEFAGLVERKTLPVPAKTKVSSVNLFLPAHHHVESVHLTATGGRPLHPALAVVQTPAREYYILRDNGFEVGCEEDGVASVWMRILGCDAHGEPIGRAAVSFEELKAYIQNL